MPRRDHDRLLGPLLMTLAILVTGQTCAEPLRVFRDCDVCPEMIELPLGEFVMEAPDSEFRRIVHYTGGKLNFATYENPYIPVNENPQNEVVVDVRIAMSKSEVTFDEWMACVDDGGCNGHIPDGSAGQSGGTSDDIRRSIADPRFKRVPSSAAILQALDNPEQLQIGGRYPVNEVSYLDALAYVDWLNLKLGTTVYRLPTEAEWEYAARAGTTTRFSQGYEPTSDQENFSGENTAIRLQQERPDLRTLGYPVPVDELDAANPWGLRHMGGNLAEITLSCYPEETERIPDWDTTSEWLRESFRPSCKRVLRGGSYGESVDMLRPATRREIQEVTRFDFIGFRVVREMR